MILKPAHEIAGQGDNHQWSADILMWSTEPLCHCLGWKTINYLDQNCSVYLVLNTYDTESYTGYSSDIPAALDSKKHMGDLNTRMNSLSCSLVPAPVVRRTKQ